MFRRSRLAPLLGVLLSLALVGTACSSSKPKASTATTVVTSSTTAKATGSVTVFAAASLTEAFTDEQTALKAADPGLSLTFSFGGSGTLVTQVQQGAPADVIATADTATMQKLVDAGLVDTPIDFARNKLEILVAPGNPKHLSTLADLAGSGLKVVLCDQTVPAGKYASQILQTAGVTVKPVSLETDVKAAVTKVTTGEADATIVYVTDVMAAGAKGTGVVIPDAQNALAVYPIAVVKATKDQAAAKAFLQDVVSGKGHAALIQRGFLPAA